MCIWEELIFQGGTGSPFEPIQASSISLRKRVGNNQAPASGKPCSKRDLIAGGRLLVEQGIVTRARKPNYGGWSDGPGTPYLWALQEVSGNHEPLKWEGAFDLLALIIRRSEPMAPKLKALMLRLACLTDENGAVKGVLSELGPKVGIKSPRTLDACLGSLVTSNCGVDYRREYVGRSIAGALTLTSTAPPKEARKSQQELEEERRALREKVWYPELIEQAIVKASRKLKSGKVSLSRQVSGFYQPIWEMQEKYPNPPLIKYALEQTLSGPVFRGEKTNNWHRYALRVAENNRWRFRQAGDPKDDQSQKEGSTMREREMAMRKLLRRAAQLNTQEEFAEARSLLGDALAQVKDLAPLFDGDETKCASQLRLAFKQGSSDFVGETVDRYTSIDFYPEWPAQG